MELVKSKMVRQRWQYKYVVVDSLTNTSGKIEDVLNVFGSEGWELVSHSIGHMLNVFVFTRPEENV